MNEQMDELVKFGAQKERLRLTHLALSCLMIFVNAVIFYWNAAGFADDFFNRRYATLPLPLFGSAISFWMVCRTWRRRNL